MSRFRENTPYDRRSSYSASTNLVTTWHHISSLQMVLTNSSKNYGH
jgi:dTDP-D-glucose 4,6-dehydratase